MWIKILCVEYILWWILTSKSVFDVANMVQKINWQRCAKNDYELLNIQACSFNMSWKKECTQSLVSCRYWIVSPISTRVPCYCQVILMTLDEYRHGIKFLAVILTVTLGKQWKEKIINHQNWLLHFYLWSYNLPNEFIRKQVLSPTKLLLLKCTS